LELNVFADVDGSLGRVWRFGVERRDPTRGIRAEARASVVVAGALSLAAITLFVAAINDLITRSTPGPTGEAIDLRWCLGCGPGSLGMGPNTAPGSD
jgi:hypothetical protein